MKAPSSGPHEITARLLRRHIPCDRTNDGAHANLRNTPIDILHAASKARKITYDSGFNGEFNDFGIAHISTDSETDSHF